MTTKLTTDDCRKWLTTDDKVQKLVRDRVGYDPDPEAWLEQCDGDEEEVAYFQKWLEEVAS